MTSRFKDTLEVPGRPELRLHHTRRNDSYLLAPLIVKNRTFLYPQWWAHGIQTPADTQPFVDDLWSLTP